MTTNPFSAQDPGGFDYSDADLQHSMASDMSAIYATHQGWAGFPHAGQFHTTAADCSHFPGSSAIASLENQPQLTDATATSNYDPTAHDTIMYDQETATVSPQQTQFKMEETAPMHYTGSTFDLQHMAVSANSSHSASSTQHSRSTLGSMSSQTSLDPQSPTTPRHGAGRGRKTEDVEPGSARATYLEKNRKAASKCRSKQRRQQEELVEEARQVERRNKCLKAEVAMLQGGMRELMEVVGQHTACPDTRIGRYVQREADRLAAVTSQSPPFFCASEDTSTSHKS
jgi:cyclic AMP-dependent transcription factor ATF-2